MEVTTSGITKTETKTLQLKDANGWIDLPAGKKLTVTNMETWIVDVVGPSAFTEKIFTVSAEGKKVKFSPGNLQAVIKKADSADEARWQFADKQYSFPARAAGSTYSANAGDVVDLFMHPESGVVTVPYAFGIPVCSSYSPATSTFADWGQYCDIYPNSDLTSTPYAKNTYRTLKQEEWSFLLTRESGANVGGTSDACYSLINLNVGGTTGTILGLLIYPDGFTWTSAMGAVPNVNSGPVPSVPYTLAQFEAMEAAGVVFLPAAGNCDSNGNTYFSSGFYWSASVYPRTFTDCAYLLKISQSIVDISKFIKRNNGYSVRLVRNKN